MASKNCYKASEVVFKAQTHLYKHMYSFVNPMCIKWAVDLGIPDIIHNHGKPITLSELVTALQLPQSKAFRVQSLMRLLAHNDFFAAVVIVKADDDDDNNKAEEMSYALTPASEILVRGTDHCLSSMVEFINNPDFVGLYHQLGKWTSGEEGTIAETALGAGGGHWDFIHQNPARMTSFNEAMESDSQLVRLGLLQRDSKSVFDGLDSLVDVGGGTGNTAKIISEAFPQLKYIVLDLPQVVTTLTGTHNLSFVGGDMFKSIPKADAVLLKWVLHNWSDDDCIKILQNCKEAISGKGKRGKVIIIETVINEKQDEHEETEVKLLIDVVMVTALNGKERDANQWKKLFMEAGFEHYNIFPTFGFRSLIELYA